MIDFKEFELENGLKVIVHEDHTIPTAVVNLLYDVGSRDEIESKTGFAHLFEHLMFGGSVNVPNYDTPLQQVGGDNNAFTSTDITNYYVTLPSQNLETAFWLESDRMMGLSFDPNVLEVQRKVVIEEFKQRYLNQPYGDVWLKLRPLAYQVHPYRWPTIGREISHIENATLDDVKTFFYKYYRPNNATLVVGGNVKFDQVKELAKKWFGDIPKGDVPDRKLPQEPVQKEARKLEIEANVPVDSIYKVYHICGKNSPDYFATDLLSDILGRGKSSRFYETLVKKQKVFSAISASISGSIDPGMLIISGKVNDQISLQDAENAIDEEVHKLLRQKLKPNELEKSKNQAESTLIFSEVEVLPRAMNLAFSELLGDPDLVNQSSPNIQKVTEDDIYRIASEVLTESNSSTLYYKSLNRG